MNEDQDRFCKRCGKCCMLFEIGPHKACETFELEVYEHPDYKGDFFLKKVRPDWAPEWAKQGVCMYLASNMQCSIYPDRPRVCRSYTCHDEHGRLKQRFIAMRKAVADPRKWTEYEMEVFGHFLTKEERSRCQSH